MLDRPDYFGHDKRRGKHTQKESVRLRDGGGRLEGARSVWRVDSWSVGPVLRREAYSSEREEVLLLRQSLRGPQRAAKRDAGQDAVHIIPSRRPKM